MALLRAGDSTTLALLFASAAAFGVLHALLPGHGKTLLAAHHGASTRRARAALLLALGDAIVVAILRVGAAGLIVTIGWKVLRRGSGGTVQVPLFEGAAGALLVLVGAGMLWHARSARQSSSDTASERSRPMSSSRLTALAVGLIPDPVAMALMSTALLANAVRPGAIALAGLAIGMAATLASSAALAVIAKRWVLSAAPSQAAVKSFSSWVARLGGAVILAAGVGLLVRVV